MIAIDLVVAVCNEEQAIRPFMEAVRNLELPPSVRLGVVFVEDGSTDATVDVLRDVCKSDPTVRYYALEKGFGQSAALWFGMTRSDADAVITMDVDQGHPTDLIPLMIQNWLDGADIVQGVRADIAGRPVFRDLGTHGFEALTRVLTGIDLRRQNVHYRLITREVKSIVLQNRRWLLFLRYNFAKTRFRTEYVTFRSQERTLGSSKYGLRRLLAHSANGILSIIPVRRFRIMLATLIVVGAGLGVMLHWMAGTLPLVLAVILLVRYGQLCHNRIFESMQVREQSLM